MGVVLNRPSEVTVGEAAPQLEETVDEAEPVYRRRPGAAELDRVPRRVPRPRARRACSCSGGSAFPRPTPSSRSSRGRPSRVRVFAGFAGWGEGQLEAEIADGDWIAQAALPEDVFTELPEQLWSSVLDAQGRQLRADRADAARPERQLSRAQQRSAGRVDIPTARRAAPVASSPRGGSLPSREPSPAHLRGIRHAQARPLVDNPPQVRGARLGRRCCSSSTSSRSRPARATPTTSRCPTPTPSAPLTCCSAASRRRPATATRSSTRSAPARSRDPAVRARMSAMFAHVAKLPHVAGVISPYGGAASGKSISADGRIAFATVVFDEKANHLPKSAARTRRRRRPRAPRGRACRSSSAARRSRRPSRPASASPRPSGCSRRSSCCC